jgi:outer membrane scaffolding protein for murein synthesis (MipA/OmpV family)
MRLLLTVLLLWPILATAQDDYTLLGAGVRTRPEFDGSKDRTVDIIPVVRFYGQPWFARTTQGILEGGARWNAARGFDVGVQLAYEQGPRDKDPGASGGVHAEWDTQLGRVPLNLLVRVRQHLDADRGNAADFRATAGVYGAHGIQAGVFGQVTVASEKHFRAYYGVGDSGLLFTSLGLLGSYELTQRWMLVGSTEVRRLSDDAARSPFVSRRTGWYASLGLGYKF